MRAASGGSTVLSRPRTTLFRGSNHYLGLALDSVNGLLRVLEASFVPGAVYDFSALEQSFANCIALD